MMTLRWQPWQEMEAARRQFDRMFEDLVPTREALLKSEHWSPAVELASTDTEFTLRAQLPGIDAKDLDVQVGQKAVSISGEHKFEKTENNGYFRSEFRYGTFQRVIPLPAPVQNEQVKAEFKDGILTLTLPRLQAVKPSVVRVNLLGDVAPEAIAPAETAQPEAISTERNSVETADVTTETTGDAWQS
ncbi:MAG: Hsp20/alpha crystallin family protein [Myxacorys californica WJT36-NPBG1]|nr:Hsp20/alpha crystallin family protein [Myxacorys californica WJT36-NPBG1]